MRSSSTTRTRTSAPSSPRRSPPRPTTSPVTARRPRPCSPRRWSTRACATSPPAPTRWTSSAASTRPSRRVNDALGRAGPRRRDDRRTWPTSPPSRRRTPSIGELIAEAFDKVGKDGVITVEESNTFGTELEFTEGMQFDKGYISPYFVTDPERMEAVLDDPLHPDQPGQDLVDRRPAARCWRRSSRPASRCSSSPRTSTARRCRPWSSTRSAGRSPPSPSRRPASATAARRCCRTSRSSPAPRSSRPRSGSSSTRSASRCSARPVASSSPRTTPRSSTAAATAPRSAAGSARSRPRSRTTDSDWDREKLQERLAKLAGGVGVIKVGAATEVELKEKKHRIEDAISATRAAIEEGIVAGGGSALVHAGSVLDDGLGLTGDEATGVRIVAPRHRRAAALDRRERRRPGLRRRRQGARGRRRAAASTPRPASTAT